MDINFELYKIFYFTALNLSFTKASESLFVTQSSISQSIKSLETKLNTSLFYRNKKKIQLTPEGEILFRHIKQAYKQIKVAEKKLETNNIGAIHIGASDTICKYFLLPFFKNFHKKYPDIKINIINQPSKATLEMIKNGLLDFGIVSISKENNYNDIELIKIKTYSEVCITGDEYFKKIGATSTLDSIVNNPMITLRNNTNTRVFLDREFIKRNVTLQPDFEMVSVDLIIEMVRSNLGVGFVMEDTLKNIDKSNDLFKIEINPPLPKRNISFATNKSFPLSNNSNLFIEHIKKMQKKSDT